ncbi:MAG TPA: adenylate/guanylate cyclase domain-containing protein [Candidatus Dormibacteraeota bacterium]|nr:adenylate/guanylate cyclase domain-containing protein [Candidatus Dormibacteraeota bacterium]
MTQLDGKTRARLPDSAFAYVDSRGSRRLPINDEAHVRNALARFNQTRFEDEAARDRARTRLLKAAKKYGIVPIGFMTGQLRSQSLQAAAGQAVIELGGMGTPEELEERLRTVLRDPTLSVLYWSDSAGAYLDRTGRAVALPADDEGRAVTLLGRYGRPMTALVHDRAVLSDPDLARTVTTAVKLAIENERLHGEIQVRASEARTLPTGLVTFLLTDLEDSTGLVRHLGDRYDMFLADVRRMLRAAIRASGGREVETRADEMFAVFEQAPAALDAALAIQRKVRARPWLDDLQVRVRVGLHTGRPAVTDTGYIGLAVHTAARICFAGHGGQILLSRATRDAVEGAQPAGVTFGDLGLHQLHGLPAPEALFQVEAADLPANFPPPRTLAAPPGRPQDR